MKWMLEDAHRVMLEGVNHLSKEQLFQSPVDGEASIGSYLMHFAECDISWLETLAGIELPEELKKRAYFDCWYDSQKPAPPAEPLEINEYLETMAETRKIFLDYVSNMKDAELEEEVVVSRKSGERRFKKKWIIYHILEHEAHHRGQMFLLIRKAGWNKK